MIKTNKKRFIGVYYFKQLGDYFPGQRSKILWKFKAIAPEKIAGRTFSYSIKK